MITITDSAQFRIKDILAEENDPSLKLRVFVQGGGCSGLTYGFTLDNAVNEDDFDLDINGTRLLVDSLSSTYLTGATVDYLEDQYGSQFTIKNPKAVTTCGCGSSFSTE
jgi:iron-sulfur cluster insertion protein